MRKLWCYLLSLFACIMFAAGQAYADPSAQINIPSTDAKSLKELTFNVASFTRFSSKSDAGTNLYDVGVKTGLLPFEKVKVEIGVDYATSGTNSRSDNHPILFNAKLATAEDALFSGMPAFAVGMYNMGTYDKPEVGVSTRQNIGYGLLAKTFPVIGRLTVGGYHGSERALATSANPSKNNVGIMASWDRTMPEISNKLWLGIDYMSGNNANGLIGFGASWNFTEQISLLCGVVVYNPFYKLSPDDGGQLPGGKPTFTTQLTINVF